MKTDKEATCLSSDWIEQHRAVLPLFGFQGSSGQPGRHKRLKTMEYQVLCLTAEEKLTPEQIAVKCQVHLDVIQKKLKMALTKARREDPSEALAEVKRLGLAPGKKTWQWGTHRRLSG